MSLPEEKNVTIDEFYKMREETTELLEYVDGIVPRVCDKLTC